jgi:hypothetical protein
VLRDRLNANVTRFAAYKSRHVTGAIQRISSDDGIPVKERGKMAKAALNVFDSFKQTEEATATSRARTAKNFEYYMQPDQLRALPALRWLPSSAVTPRQAHVRFYGRVWAKDDPFWEDNAPGSEWNCQCDVEETTLPPTDNDDIPQPDIPQGLEGNPYETGEIFTDEASYIRAAGSNRKEKQAAEMECEKAYRKQLLKSEQMIELREKTASCTVQGEQKEVKFIRQGMEEYIQSMLGKKDYFWLKNEILPELPEYIRTAEYAGRKETDLSHNSNPATLRLKQKTDYFYYFKTELPNGKSAYLHLGRYRESGTFYLYTITKDMPANAETP